MGRGGPTTDDQRLGDRGGFRVGSCAIQAGSGAVICWGNNSYGQSSPPPSVDGSAGTATAAAAGGRHTLALPEPDTIAMLMIGVPLINALARQRARIEVTE